MPAFTLAQIGLDHAEQSLCATVLALAGGIEIAQWRQTENVDQADLIITNGERQTTLDALLETRGNNALPLIAALSTNPITSEHRILHAQRPLTYTAVVTLLQEAERALGGSAHSLDEWTDHFLHPEAVTVATSVATGTPPSSTKGDLDTPAPATEGEGTPAEEAPAEEVPAEEVPAEEVPAEEVPAEEVPAEEVPAEEVPAEEVPAEEVPDEEVPDDKTPTSEIQAVKRQTNTPESSAPEIPTLEIAIDDIEILESLLAKPDAAIELNEVILTDSATAPYLNDTLIGALPQTKANQGESRVDASADGTTAKSRTSAKISPDETHLAQVIPLPIAGNQTEHTALPEELEDIPEPQAESARDTSPPTTPSDLFRPARRFVPKLRLLGLIQEIIVNGDSYRVSHPDFPDILIWPRAGLYQCNSDIMALPEVFRCPWSEFSVDIAKKQPSPQLINASQPLIRLRYLAALHGSEGRLMLGVNAQATLKLKTLPDFDLLDCTPDQQRLALHLHDYPATLGELATATQTTIATVIDFTNACREIGLIEEIHQPLKSDEEKPQRRGLLYRLKRSWKRLHHQTEDTP